MKNMKVSVKLLVSFATLVVFLVVVGGFGIFGLSAMADAEESLYKDQATPLGDIAAAMEYFQRIRVQARNAAIYTGDSEQLTKITSDIENRQKLFVEAITAYKASIETDEGNRLYNEIMQQYENVVKREIEENLNGARQGLPTIEIIDNMEDLNVAVDIIATDLRELTTNRIALMDKKHATNVSAENALIWGICGIMAAAVIVSCVLTFYVSGIISKPLITLTSFMKKAGTTGDISLTQTDRDEIARYSVNRDEIGQLISAAASFVNRISEVSDALETVSGGDLTVDINLLSATDVMGLSLQKMLENLNGMFGQIQNATAQVASGSSQIADGASALAQGSTEQAATVEELSASISEIAHKTKANSEMASRAASLASEIMRSAEKGSSQMNEMMSAVDEISQASQNISKVIKVIEDIAFQTNILALNAAVEAARAGQHGKGFAVVAEEVRNLAAKSAEAAKDTGGLIANSIEKSELGARIANETSLSFTEIVKEINESNTITLEIARSSEEQAAGIEQINEGIDQVTQVVQQNSATAEQSAAASEELNSQSDLLEQMISRFKLRNSSASQYYEMPKTRNVHALSSGASDKY